MRIIDISQPVYDACPNCPAHPPARSQLASTHEADDWQLELLTMASHTGSHIDAPLHKIKGGRSIDQLPLQAFVAPAVVVDLRDSQADRAIDAATLAAQIGRDVRDHAVLLATGWGERRRLDEAWLRQSPFLAPDGAQWLVERGIRGVGIDHYSIGGSREPGNAQTHQILLSRGVWILEELKLGEEACELKAPATLWALPINLVGHSGAFCRPVLVVE